MLQINQTPSFYVQAFLRSTQFKEKKSCKCKNAWDEVTVIFEIKYIHLEFRKQGNCQDKFLVNLIIFHKNQTPSSYVLPLLRKMFLNGI